MPPVPPLLFQLVDELTGRDEEVANTLGRAKREIQDDVLDDDYDKD
jgi:hypothetical protein